MVECMRLGVAEGECNKRAKEKVSRANEQRVSGPSD